MSKFYSMSNMSKLVPLLQLEKIFSGVFSCFMLLTRSLYT